MFFFIKNLRMCNFCCNFAVEKLVSHIMKIIQIGSYPLSPDCINGGVEASVYGLAQALVEHNTIDVFDMPRIGGKDRVELSGSLTIHRYANPGKHNKDAVLRISEIVRDIVALGPDVCHVHGTGVFSKQIYCAIQQYRIPLMLTVHGLLREEKKQALLRKPSLKAVYQYVVQSRDEREILETSHRIIVDTAYVENKLREYGLKKLPEIHVIPQGIDAVYYGIECNPKSNTLLSVGAIGPRKGHVYTVEMFNRLRSRGIDAKLRIIGSLADNAYYEQLKQKIASSTYREDISLDVNLPREELLRAYADAKLFVLHSREESQGIVFAEAMATGLPVVATKIGGIPYVVAEGKSGLLCPYGDVGAMTKNVTQLWTDEKQWQAFSCEAKAIVKEYEWGNIAEKICRLYRDNS